MVWILTKSIIKFTDLQYGFTEVVMAAVMCIFLYLFGGIELAISIVVTVTLFDLVTGIIKAMVTGEFQSKRMLNSLWKIIGYTITLSMLHLLFGRLLPMCYEMKVLPEILIEPLRVFPYVAAMLIALREGASIIENLVVAKILPKPLATKIGIAFKTVREVLSEDEN